MKFHLTQISSNEKTGPIPVSTSSAETCPTTCSFKGAGCYAENFPMSTHWDKVTSGERGVEWDEFLEQIKALPLGQLWRHNQAGDLPGAGNQIDRDMLLALVYANQDKRGYTYTHKHHGADNRSLIAYANDGGFAVNLSADNENEAVGLRRLNIGPVVVVVPRWQGGKRNTTREVYGELFKLCPALVFDEVTCMTCKLCSKIDRKEIVVFPAHGASANKIKEQSAPKLF